MLSVDRTRADAQEPSVLRPLYKPRPVPNRYVAVFAAVAVAQFLDLATFIPAVARVGIGAESNPFARTLYLSAGPLGPAALKAAAIAMMLLALARVVRRFPAYIVPSTALVIGIGLVGAASNLLFGVLR